MANPERSSRGQFVKMPKGDEGSTPLSQTGDVSNSQEPKRRLGEQDEMAQLYNEIKKGFLWLLRGLLGVVNYVHTHIGLYLVLKIVICCYLVYTIYQDKVLLILIWNAVAKRLAFSWSNQPPRLPVPAPTTWFGWLLSFFRKPH